MIDIESTRNAREEMIADLLPDLTPLLDVLFMLIVFLTLTSNSITNVFDVNLPEDQNNVAKSLDNEDSISITIFANDNKWAINGIEYNSFEKFKAKIIKVYNSSKSKKVIIFGDKDSKMQTLMSLLTFMRANSIEAADIVMNK